MSRLIKKLRQVSESIAPSLGFKTSSTVSTQPMLLIAFFPESYSNQITGITDAGVDAVLVHVHDLQEGLQAINKIADNTGNIPWGLWPDKISVDDVKKLSGSGSDFITFRASKAPASLLGEETGKIMKLHTPIDDSIIRPINQMAIDAILLDYREEIEGITVSHLIDCQHLSSLVRKPLLVAIAHIVNDKELRALWEAGANGVLVEVKDGSQSDIIRMRQAISSFPQTQRKSEERRAILPRPAGESSSISLDDE